MRRILLVEDNAADSNLWVESIRESYPDIEVVVARNGSDAWEILDGDESPPDLALLDINLPGMSGFEILRKIREDTRFRSLVAIMLTSTSRKEDVLLSYRLGANAFISKPKSLADLKDAVRAIDNFWFRTAILPS